MAIPPVIYCISYTLRHSLFILPTSCSWSCLLQNTPSFQSNLKTTTDKLQCWSANQIHPITGLSYPRSSTSTHPLSAKSVYRSIRIRSSGTRNSTPSRRFVLFCSLGRGGQSSRECMASTRRSWRGLASMETTMMMEHTSLSMLSMVGKRNRLRSFTRLGRMEALTTATFRCTAWNWTCLRS